VVVFFAVFLLVTVTPINGAPSSSARTVPDTVLFCAFAEKDRREMINNINADFIRQVLVILVNLVRKF
jgi:hypothetical protein